jgi:hypothetical protein
MLINLLTSSAISVDRGNRMIYGTDDGVYFSNHRDERLRHPTKVISMPDVTQVDVLEEFQLLVVLSGRRWALLFFSFFYVTVLTRLTTF